MKYLVEYEYSTALIDSYKKASITIDAPSDIGAKSRAEKELKAKYKYVRVISATLVNGNNNDLKEAIYAADAYLTRHYRPGYVILTVALFTIALMSLIGGLLWIKEQLFVLVIISFVSAVIFTGLGLLVLFTKAKIKNK